jgi:small conductance mechanosensitive channel
MDKILSTDHVTAVVDRLWGVVVVFVPKLIAAIVILLVAIFVARRAAAGVSQLITRTGHIDRTFSYVVAELVRYSILVVAIVAALEQVGVRATSLFAVLGAAGLAIGLALQGTLSNIAAGLMILWLRPFRIGDYIEVNNVPGLGGTILQTGLFACQLQTFDGLFLFVPNSALWNVPLRNFTKNACRLLSFLISVPKAVDWQAAAKALEELAEGNPRIVQKPRPIAFIERITGDGTTLNFRIWARPEHVGPLQQDLPGAVSARLAPMFTDGAVVQVNRIIPPDTDPSRLMDKLEILD